MNVEAYSVRAKQHAPKTIEESRAAAHRMLDEGYSDHGISAALTLAVEQVRRMLGDFQCGQPEWGAGGDSGAPVTSPQLGECQSRE